MVDVPSFYRDNNNHAVRQLYASHPVAFYSAQMDERVRLLLDPKAALRQKAVASK